MNPFLSLINSTSFWGSHRNNSALSIVCHWLRNKWTFDKTKKNKSDEEDKEEEGGDGVDETYIPPMYKTTLDVISPGGLVRIFTRLDFDAEVRGNSPHATNNQGTKGSQTEIG